MERNEHKADQMSHEIHPGKYLGHIVNYGLRDAKDNGVMAVIEMDYKDSEGDLHRLIWRGSFSGTALQYTLKTLLVCGLDRDAAVLADGPQSGALNMEKEFVITVSAEEYQGKTYYRIAWINEPGLSNLLTRAEAVARLAGLNVQAEIMAMRAKTGYNKPQPKLENLPF
jgi:hypothetical protein